MTKRNAHPVLPICLLILYIYVSVIRYWPLFAGKRKKSLQLDAEQKNRKLSRLNTKGT